MKIYTSMFSIAESHVRMALHDSQSLAVWLCMMVVNIKKRFPSSFFFWSIFVNAVRSISPVLGFHVARYIQHVFSQRAL